MILQITTIPELYTQTGAGRRVLPSFDDLGCIKRWSFPFGSNLRLIFSMHLLILPYLDCSDSHAYTISLELCAGFNDSTHKTSLLHFESIILYAPLHKDKLRTTAGDRGGAGLFAKLCKISRNFANFLSVEIRGVLWYSYSIVIYFLCTLISCSDSHGRDSQWYARVGSQWYISLGNSNVIVERRDTIISLESQSKRNGDTLRKKHQR